MLMPGRAASASLGDPSSRMIHWVALRKGSLFQWIDFMENLQETKDFPIKYGAFL